MSLAEEQSETLYFHTNGQPIQATLTWDTDSPDVITVTLYLKGENIVRPLKMNIDTFKSTYLDMDKDFIITLRGGEKVSGKFKSSAGGARRTRKRKMRRSRSRAKSHRQRRH
jgi:hypothetical protein